MLRHNLVLEGINRIFTIVVREKIEEDLANECLAVALEVTGSLIGFAVLVNDDGLLRDISISDMRWEHCRMYDKADHRRPPENFILHDIVSCVVNSRKGFFTKEPLSHPYNIGLQYGYPPITSFLCIPFV